MPRPPSTDRTIRISLLLLLAPRVKFLLHDDFHSPNPTGIGWLIPSTCSTSAAHDQAVISKLPCKLTSLGSVAGVATSLVLDLVVLEVVIHLLLPPSLNRVEESPGFWRDYQENYQASIDMNMRLNTASYPVTLPGEVDLCGSTGISSIFMSAAAERALPREITTGIGGGTW